MACWIERNGLDGGPSDASRRARAPSIKGVQGKTATKLPTIPEKEEEEEREEVVVVVQRS